VEAERPARGDEVAGLAKFPREKAGMDALDVADVEEVGTFVEAVLAVLEERRGELTPRGDGFPAAGAENFGSELAG